MCKAMEEMRNEAEQKGVQIGEWKKSLEIAKQMLASGVFPKNQIMQITGLTEEQLQAAEEELTQKSTF